MKLSKSVYLSRNDKDKYLTTADIFLVPLGRFLPLNPADLPKLFLHTRLLKDFPSSIGTTKADSHYAHVATNSLQQQSFFGS